MIIKHAPTRRNAGVSRMNGSVAFRLAIQRRISSLHEDFTIERVYSTRHLAPAMRERVA